MAFSNFIVLLALSNLSVFMSHSITKSETLENFIDWVKGDEHEKILSETCVDENKFFSIHGRKLGAKSFEQIRKKKRKHDELFTGKENSDGSRYVIILCADDMEKVASQTVVYEIAKLYPIIDFLLPCHGCGKHVSISEDGKPKVRFFHMYDFSEPLNKNLKKLRQAMDSELKKVQFIRKILTMYQRLDFLNITHGAVTIKSIHALQRDYNNIRLHNFRYSYFEGHRTSYSPISPVYLCKSLSRHACYTEYPSVANLLAVVYYGLVDQEMSEEELYAKLVHSLIASVDRICNPFEDSLDLSRKSEVDPVSAGRLRILKILCNYRKINNSIHPQDAYQDILSEILLVANVFKELDL